MRPHYNRYPPFIFGQKPTFCFYLNTSCSDHERTTSNYLTPPLNLYFVDIRSPILWIERYSFLITTINRTIRFLAYQEYSPTFLFFHWELIREPNRIMWCVRWSRNPIPFQLRSKRTFGYLCECNSNPRASLHHENIDEVLYFLLSIPFIIIISPSVSPIRSGSVVGGPLARAGYP